MPLPITAENLSVLSPRDRVDSIMHSVRQMQQINLLLNEKTDDKMHRAAMAQQLDRLHTFVWRFLKDLDEASTPQR